MLPLWALIRRYKASMNGTRLILMSHTREINIRIRYRPSLELSLRLLVTGFSNLLYCSMFSVLLWISIEVRLWIAPVKDIVFQDFNAFRISIFLKPYTIQNERADTILE
jgi:hypothetical protein